MTALPPFEGPGAFDEHRPIPSVRSALGRLIREDAGSAALTVLALLLATSILEVLGGVGRALALALVAGHTFAVVDAAAHGRPRLPEPSDFDGLEDWLLPLGKAAFALAPAIGLVLADYVAGGVRVVLVPFGFEPIFGWTPRRWILAAIGLALSPPGIITTAVSGHALAALHVPLNVRFAVRARRDLPLLVGIGWGLLAGAWAIDALGLGRSSWAAFVLVRAVSLSALSLAAFAFGWTVYRRADDFGIRRRPEHVRTRLIYETPEGR